MAPDDDEALPSSCLSASAHTRILIWRSEVACAFDPPLLPPSSASTSSVPSVPSSSSTAASSSLLPHDSRGRRFWRRIVRRVSSRPEPPAPCPQSSMTTVGAALVAAEVAAAGGAPARGAPADQNQTSRTDMYTSMPPYHDDEQLLGAPESNRGALKQKQDRLHRAARLLLQQNGASPSAV